MSSPFYLLKLNIILLDKFYNKNSINFIINAEYYKKNSY